MALGVSQNFSFVCNAIQMQCLSQHSSQSDELVQLLTVLNPTEKLLAAKFFCQLPWNVGNLNVLRTLHRLRFLTSTEYILNIKDAVHLQLILSEFFEDSHSHELLAHLFRSATFDSLNSIRLNYILEEALRLLFNELVINPKSGNLGYMESLSKLLEADIKQKLTHMHINVLLDLHTSSVEEAYKQFSNWINEGVDELHFMKLLCNTIFLKHQEEALTLLFRLSSLEHFKQWKFYLILVQSVARFSNTQTIVFINRYLKESLLQIANVPSQHSMLKLLITARAVAAKTMNIQQNLDAYASWYKQNIGEMCYMLNKEQFVVVLNLLQNVICFENEEQFVEIHAAIAISPAPMCAKQVQSYKNKCKEHLSQLKIRRKASIKDNI